MIEEDILEGKPKKEWVKTVKKNLSERFPDGIEVGNNKIFITNKSKKEMTYSKYVQWLRDNNEEVYRDRFRAINNADEVIKASRDYVNEEPLHARKDDVQNFGRGKVLVEVGGRGYQADVVVASQNNGSMILYDVIGMEPVEISKKGKKMSTATDVRESEFDRSAMPNNNITYEEENSNKKFSLKDTSPADIDRLREENKALREANELLREQFKLTKGRKVSRKAVDKLSGRILKAYQSKYDRDTLTDNLITFYDAVHKASNDPVKQEEVVDTLYQGYERLSSVLSFQL